MIELLPFFYSISYQGFIQVYWEWGLFPKIGKNIGYLGMKIPGVSCKI